VRTTSAPIHIHDVWDGQLYREFCEKIPTQLFTTTKPGYNRMKLGDYIREYQPSAVVISTPHCDWPLVTLYDSALRQHPSLPFIFVANANFWPNNQAVWNLFWPPRQVVLSRTTVTADLLKETIATEIVRLQISRQ
jgi:hypothetical protein